MLASICLPAYNEERTIGATLAELQRLGPEVDEILVCLNGCTDNTAAVVGAFRERDPRISVMESALGKNHAWNALVLRARNSRLVFTDADVAPSPKAIMALVKALDESPHAAIAAAFEQPHGSPPAPVGGIIGLLSTSLGQDYISGRLYAIDRERLGAVMAERGLIEKGQKPQLPADLVTEDSWLTAVTSGDALIVVPEAPIHFDVDGIDDVVRVLARNEAARQQLRTDYPTLYAANGRRWASIRTAPHLLTRRLRATRGPAAAAKGLAGMALRVAANRLFRKQIEAQRDRIIADVRSGRGELVMATSGRLPSKGG